MMNIAIHYVCVNLLQGPDLPQSGRVIHREAETLPFKKKDNTYLRGSSFFIKKRQHSVVCRTVLICMQ